MLFNKLLSIINHSFFVTSAQASSSQDSLLFFVPIYNFLRDEIAEFGVNLLGRFSNFLSGIAITLLTLWIIIQGYRIVIGQSRDSMMVLVFNSSKAVLIVGTATIVSYWGANLHEILAVNLQRTINSIITGNDELVGNVVDRSLFQMQLALNSIDMLKVPGNSELQATKSQAMWMAGFGAGGPAITGGTLMILNTMALALFVGFAPLFIMCLLFEQTKHLFQKWLFYGLATLFSLAVLSFTVVLALDLIIAVSFSFWTEKILSINPDDANSMEGLSSIAMQQGALGLILTILIVSAPPMAGAFFNGVLGQYSSYNQVANNVSKTDPSGRPLNNHLSSNNNQNNNSSNNSIQSAENTNPALTQQYKGNNIDTQLGNEVRPAGLSQKGKAV